jgi:N-acetylmuramoyl-L-alanine amidase
MRHDSVARVQRIFIWLFLLAVLAIGLIAAQTAGLGLPDANGVGPQGVVGAAWDKQVALVSGHAGNDSGAVCEDENGQATIKEADINAKVAELAADRLRRAGADVVVLQEYDPRLDDLSVDVFLSIHADSCIDATGFKSTHYDKSAIPYIADRLVNCINSQYAAATGLAENLDTITENMTEYHAFRRIDAQTPAAILELGFLGGDHDLLVQRPELPAKGIADGLLCFLEGEGQIKK